MQTRVDPSPPGTVKITVELLRNTFLTSFKFSRLGEKKAWRKRKTVSEKCMISGFASLQRRPRTRLPSKEKASLIDARSCHAKMPSTGTIYCARFSVETRMDNGLQVLATTIQIRWVGPDRVSRPILVPTQRHNTCLASPRLIRTSGELSHRLRAGGNRIGRQ